MNRIARRAAALPLRDPITTTLLAAVLILVLAFALMLRSTTPQPQGSETSVTDVLALAAGKGLVEGTLRDYDHIVEVKTAKGTELWAGLPSNGAGISALQTAFSKTATPLRIDTQSAKQTRRIVVQVLLPVLILVLLFTLLARMTQQGGADDVRGFSRWRGRRRSGHGDGGSGGPSFADVAGAPAAVAELRELCDLLHDPDRYAALGARAPRGALLVGPPGTGKTLLARATAGEAGASFFAVSGAEFVESLVGIGAARIRDLFAQAREAAPAIVFIDELDAVGRKRGAGVGQGNDEREQTLNQLLVEIDGFDAGSGIVVLAATNRPDVLDPALLRPGRFDRQITVDAPDAHGRAHILSLYLQGRPTSPEVDPAVVAMRCPGFTGAELENVANEAALLAARDRRPTISEDDLDEAIDRVVSGPRATAHLMTDAELQSLAIHEASHAIVARALGGEPARRLSIVARGRQLGAAAVLHADRERLVLRREDLERQLATTMAGAAGERIAFGDLSTAVHDDLHAATTLARSMVTSFGMSELGPITIGERSAEVFLGASLQELGSVGQATLDTIDTQTRQLVEAAEAQAEAVLRAHWATVQSIGTALIEHETLSEDVVAELLEPISAPEDR